MVEKLEYYLSYPIKILGSKGFIGYFICLWYIALICLPIIVLANIFDFLTDNNNRE